MEPIFANQTTLTKHIFYEIGKATYSRARAAFFIISGICLLCIIGYLLLAGMDNELIYIGGVLAVVLILIPVITVRYFAHLQYRAVLTRSGEAVPRVVYTFSDKKIDFDGRISYDYTQITKMYETRNLIVLIIDNIAFSLEKNGFTTGTWKNFTRFIQQKCAGIPYISR